jgi:hypothetical protein
MNNKPFSYWARHGTSFSCESCDFSKPVKVIAYDNLKKPEFYSRDLSEMIAYHVMNILPELNGFRGYDCIQFEF